MTEKKSGRRVAASFNEAQVLLMHDILTQLMRGGDPRMLTRSKAFGPLAGLVSSMRRRSQEPEPPKKTLPAAEPADQTASDPASVERA